MKTITCTDLEGEMKTNLEAHLKGIVEGKEDHFFDVNKYPTGAFEITKFFVNKNDKFELSGNLTIKGIKHNISFPVYFHEDDDMIVIKSDFIKIDRTKWGINYGSKSIFDDLGDKFIDDVIAIKLFIKARK